MLKKIGLIVATAIVLFLVVVSLQPAEFKVERSALIATAPEVIFNEVNDLRNWEKWSPWAKLDPNMKRTYSGAPSGVGAAFAWSGNSKAGEGQSTIVESQPASLVRLRLEMLSPMKANNNVEFTFKPEGSATRVTWSMNGQNGFVGKAFSMLMNIDKMVGADFEAGLAQLKANAEATKL